MGRRTKLTPETQERIIRAVRAGLRYKEAAQAAGIDESTFYKWVRLGEQQTTGIYSQFRDALKKAEAEGEFALLAKIQQEASNGVWQAAAWILERRYRERWGRNLDITTAGEPLRVVLVWPDEREEVGEDNPD